MRGSLRTRLSLAMALLVAGAVLLAAVAALRRVEAAFAAQFDERVTSLLDAASRRYEALGGRAVQRMDALADGVLADPALVERLLLRPEPTSAIVLESAGRMRRMGGLDLLEILDAQGRILSSGHWFEQAGFRDEAALDLPASAPALRPMRLPGGEALAVVVRRDVTLGGARLVLVGGTFVGREFLDEIAPGEGEALVLLGAPPASPVLAAAGAGARMAAAPLQAALTAPRAEAPAPAQRLGRIDSADGGSWTAGSLLLSDAAGDPAATLVVAVDRAGLAALLDRLRWSFLGVGAGTTLLAALVGAWVSRRTTRPLSELVGTVEAISAGKSDAPFPPPSGDEVGQLVESFSRMHQTLGAQQARLLAAERVAAWREVAQRVAHEVKNPLSPIRLTVENMGKAKRQAPEMFDQVFDEGSRLILEEVDQLGRIVSEFSEFARLPAPRPAPADLDALVDDALSLFASQPGLAIERRREGTLPPIPLDADQIARALKNLLGNAVEAMRATGGTLAVRTALEGGAAVVEICDTGPGFSRDAQGRLFEPYFTTKAKGTGLGMAIALRIAADHGGSLTAENRPEGGARVVLRLPAGAAEAEGVA